MSNITVLPIAEILTDDLQLVFVRFLYRVVLPLVPHHRSDILLKSVARNKGLSALRVRPSLPSH
jgi:hypothetical protein